MKHNSMVTIVASVLLSTAALILGFVLHAQQTYKHLPGFAETSPCGKGLNDLQKYIQIDGIPYVCKDGSLVINSEALKAMDDADKKKADLYWALRTRVLTDDELEQVRNIGTWLVISRNMPFIEKDITEEYNNALYHQAKLRLAAKCQSLPK